ncbi:MAG TPA: prepilin peptidase [Acidobacteriaceae bacterium]|nr:prepilin peptidase [Acidobacteriaceae bacterium]
MSYALPFELAAILLGLLLGSFLNVAIYRLPRGESLASPRSHCPACGETIRWYDNIPLLSWILLRGRCRHCHAPISWRYPAVELATAVWFLLAYLATHRAILADFAAAGPDHTARLLLDGVGVSIAGFLLIGLAVIDWQTQTLPDALTLTGTAIGFFLTCVQAVFLRTGEGDIHLHPRSNMRLQSPGSFAARGDVFLTGTEALVLGRVAAILAAAGLLLLIRATYKALRGREGMGLGDAKLLGMIAAFLGFGDAMLAFFLGMIACAGYAVVLLARGRATAATKLPLGSFLAAGGLVTALLGEAVLTWYKGLL